MGWQRGRKEGKLGDLSLSVPFGVGILCECVRLLQETGYGWVTAIAGTNDCTITKSLRYIQAPVF